jgi:hypothetical protein
MSYIHTSGDTSETRPTRVRLPDSTTRTMEAVTDEILAEAGWSWQEPVVEPVAEPVVTSETVVDPYPSSTGTVTIEE